MWFLLAVAVMTSGQVNSASHPEQFASEAECQKALAQFFEDEFKAVPDIVAVSNQKCVKVDAPK
jgi:hypothetical protein